jgi:hypothetical protein
MGICDSRGVIYDFAGPYSIGEDKMAFGNATRYLQLDVRKVHANCRLVSTCSSNSLTQSGENHTPSQVPGAIAAGEKTEMWDDAVRAGCKIYSRRVHNLCCDNCHSHVAVCLEHMRSVATLTEITSARFFL